MLLVYKFHTILSLHSEITGQNLKVIAYSYIELWFFEVTNQNVNVCGSLIQSHIILFITVQQSKDYNTQV